MSTCTIEINSKEYTLCLTREAVKEIENMGFNIQNYVDKPVNSMDLLWYGGFIHNHKDVNYNLACKLLTTFTTPVNTGEKDEEGNPIAECGDIQEVLDFLSGEYSNFVYAPTDTARKKKAKIVKA